MKQIILIFVLAAPFLFAQGASAFPGQGLFRTAAHLPHKVGHSISHRVIWPTKRAVARHRH
jgi:hypothetical protein